MKGRDEKLQADRSAWLESSPGDIEHVIGAEGVTADEYWRTIEGTTAWAVFRLGRRQAELLDAVESMFRSRRSNSQ